VIAAATIVGTGAGTFDATGSDGAGVCSADVDGDNSDDAMLTIALVLTTATLH
jgi:hypothetical protein